jgi:hypothetical protein
MYNVIDKMNKRFETELYDLPNQPPVPSRVESCRTQRHEAMQDVDNAPQSRRLGQPCQTTY